jgi:two-component system CheB/CheR fusion protein
VTQRLLLEQFAPAAVLINRNYEALCYSGPCTRYLEFPAGQPTHDVTRMAREGLHTKLRGAIHQAIRANEPVVLPDVPVNHDGGFFPARVAVRPVQVPEAAEGLFLITFEELTPSGRPSPPPDKGEGGHEPGLRQLEQELDATREDLQSTVEELETANEELKASNEEVLSTNEELRSTNEQLLSSREELQSLNEELSTVNAQLQDKIEALERANNDIANLLRCTDIATVFIDAAHRIKLFTPAATRLFGLTAPDIGRPIDDVPPRFSDPELLGDVRWVLRQLAPREKEVSTGDGYWWVRRVLPYRTSNDRVEGAVLTFVDITERKRAADAVVRRLAAIVESSADAIFSKDADGTIRTWNRAAERLYGYSPAEAVGRSVRMLVPDDRAVEWDQIMSQLARGEPVQQLETERVRKEGQRVAVALTVSPIRDGDGKVVSASVIARDIGERKHGQQALRDREERLQAILNTVDDSIITIDRRGLIQAINPATERAFGYTAAELIGQRVNMLMPSPYGEEHDDYLARYLRTGEKHVIGTHREAEARRKDGSVFPVELAVSEIEHLQLFTGIIRDLTQRRQLERDVVETASLEQRRIGQDLHDTVAQELTALNLLAGELATALRPAPAKVARILERMGQGLHRGQLELRTVLRGLLPVAVDSEGLMAALADLTDHTRRKGKVACTLDCPKPVAVEDNVIATHLYLIAQEAVRNAVKHARPRNIRVSLVSNRLLVLRVQDDGIGMPARPTAVQGLGLRIMRNRAAIIGAKLTIEPAEPTGTVVTCALPRRNHEPEKGDTRPGPDRR